MTTLNPVYFAPRATDARSVDTSAAFDVAETSMDARLVSMAVIMVVAATAVVALFAG